MELKKYRKLRKKKKWRQRALFFLLALSIFTGLAYYALWGAYFTIDKISISGEVDAGAGEKLKSWLSLRAGSWYPANNYFFFPQKELSDFLVSEGFAAFETKRDFPDGLNITFFEVAPWAMFCRDRLTCYFADQNSLLYEKAPVFSGNPLPIIKVFPEPDYKIGDTALGAEDVGFIKDIFSQAGDFGLKFTEAEALPDSKEAKFFTGEGWYLFLSMESGAHRALSDLRLLLDRKVKEDISRLLYIDMRFANKAFYKLK